MHVFKSKIDNWVLICLLLSVSACLLGASVPLMIGGITNYVFAAIILIAGAGFPVWIYVSTRYIVSGDDLKIISGPFTWNIPIQSIISLQETQIAATSPALSFDRLEITYGEDKVIIVSPVDKEKFIQKLGKEKLIGSAQRDGTKAAAKDARKKLRKTK
ncbi:PH domain-containing protein [Nitrosomonas sp. Is35]|uniref:PH domain-containing protein n=1 Tax=unclassified Nitrosomonas TaxID=2609265 RepID=UPI00294B201B|nr:MULTISPECIES: PH domain-containing protein [unclassified Nitrosomonas]MDV6340617.1 PH domain-containing protein [Nitrosomonas sp. Is24]MDV6346374.1 PH domain-containing protein [Nitrosomonas sp. Is35]